LGQSEQRQTGLRVAPDQLGEYLDRSYAFFGHCQGALLAHAIVTRIEEIVFRDRARRDEARDLALVVHARAILRRRIAIDVRLVRIAMTGRACRLPTCTSSTRTTASTWWRSAAARHRRRKGERLQRSSGRAWMGTPPENTQRGRGREP